MLREQCMEKLLEASYKNRMLDVYDYCAEQWKDDSEIFLSCKSMADEMVEEKLVKYSDERKTELGITNYGKYWYVHGGYLVYLKESEKKNKSAKDKHYEEIKEDLKEARLKFTHYRIVTYWWSFGLSLISFLLSLLNLYLILSGK